ncbi:MAG: hypothetical protein LBG73_10480 [Spirochaetaceae bacterium]|jgi:hypothetical protein|nr:hypothetical protein [Spirochaetaceae bacterium]
MRLSIIKGKFGFQQGTCILSLFFLAGLGVAACYEFMSLSVQRRTFMFYGIGNDMPVVEERMLPLSASDEAEIKRYVEEVLLGPVSPKTAPLFCRDTYLRSLLYRAGKVYADLSESAALPPLEDAPPREGEIQRNLQTLDEEIRRNFPAVREVILFINGNRVMDLKK